MIFDLATLHAIRWAHLLTGQLNHIDTVQHQYVGGPLTIVRWAPIVNCHIFPGPAIITALAEAAHQAIVAYNTSVQTDISASPAPSVIGSVDDIAEPEEEHRDYLSTRSEEDIYEDDYEDDDARFARKQSVVSVSTTISMKSEALSPPPGHMRPTLSRNSTSESPEGVRKPSTSAPGPGVGFDGDDGDDPTERLAMLDHLGPPPFLRSLLILAQMSSANNFFTPEYTAACLTQARAHRDFVMGFIAQQALNEQPDDVFITMTPGVQLAAGGDGKGQQYNTPATVIAQGGTDVIIVGRGIYGATDRRQAAAEYRREGWRAYEERVRLARKASVTSALK